MLDKRYSPDQVSGRLKLKHPDYPSMQISHETIYQSLYVYSRGELKRELKAQLRRGQTTRKRRGRKENRGRIPNAVSIHDRPKEVEGRLVPGHHEGDLIKGSIASNSAVGTIVERTTGYLTLLHLPQGYGANHVADAIIIELSALPDWFAKTLTWDRGTEMCQRPGHPGHPDQVLLRRPLHLLATRQQREHQWPAPRLHAQKHRPVGLHRPGPAGDRRRSQRPAP